MKVEIWSDVVCPWCYVGKRHFEEALSRFGHADEVEVTWRSFELDPDSPARVGLPMSQILQRKYGMTEEQAVALRAEAPELTVEKLDITGDDVAAAAAWDLEAAAVWAIDLDRVAELAPELVRYAPSDVHDWLSRRPTGGEVASEAGVAG